MAASDQIFLVVDAGTPVAAFTARRELTAYLKRRIDTFITGSWAISALATLSGGT